MAKQTSRSVDDDATPEERLAALTTIRQHVHRLLQNVAERRVAFRNTLAWEHAYDHSGPGSSYRRADEIEAIYRGAAPSIEFDRSAEAQELLNAVYEAIQTAAEEVDGRLD